jgi:dipeptidyl aminopeptidase/acylaminoacyl peptidase
VDDLADARNWCVANGIATPRLCILHGTSWGAYLTLLAVGRHPQEWGGAIAASPIADLVACYNTSTPSQQQLFDDIFGGGPHGETLASYSQASPLSHLADVSVPVQMFAYANDARCPLDQIQNYAAVAHDHGKHVDLAVLPGGHRSHQARLRIEQMRRCRTFIKQLIEDRDALSGR